jgi:hypothetical protein
MRVLSATLPLSDYGRVGRHPPEISSKRLPASYNNFLQKELGSFLRRMKRVSQNGNSPRWAIMAVELCVDTMKNQVEHFTPRPMGFCEAEQ